MARTLKTLLLGGVAALALLLAVPASSNAHPWVVGPGRPYAYYGYNVRPYARYYGWSSYPGYYYGPGVQVYRYGAPYYGYYHGYGPRGEVRVGPLDVWW